MEVCVPCTKSACLDVHSGIGSATDPCNSIPYSSGELSMNDLKICLTELVIIKEGERLTSGHGLSSRKNDIDNGMMEYGGSDSDQINLNDSASDECLSKCATFPPPSGLKPSEDAVLNDKANHEDDITAEVSELNGSPEPSNQCFSLSISLPLSSKLVSAMKGSREKHGIPPKKLSVSWAPDVYDPIPTSVSHVPSNKNQRNLSYGRKSGKHKHKSRGKSAQGSSRGKEKKQGRKNSRSAGKFLPFHEVNGGDRFGDPQFSSVDFDVGSPDPFCGSSFLKTPVAKLHYPVAEAT